MGGKREGEFIRKQLRVKNAAISDREPSSFFSLILVSCESTSFSRIRQYCGCRKASRRRVVRNGRFLAVIGDRKSVV